MRALPDLQARFAAALADRATAHAPWLRGPPGRTAWGLGVYRAHLEGNCANALAAAYPIVRKIVGAEFFDALARAYRVASPSQSGDLHRYGAGLARFVAEFAPVADLVYLPDVARLEWLAHRAYFAADAAAFDVAALVGRPAEQLAELRLGLAPSCALLESPWPLARIWAVHQDDYDGAFDVDLDAGPDRVLVHRPRWRAEVISLAPGDFAFLDAIARGEALGAALASGVVLDAAFNPATALARWIHAHVIDRRV